MIRRVGRLPDGIARDFKADRDLGKFGSDRLMLDNVPPALDAQLRIIKRCFVGGTADAITATYNPSVGSLTDGLICFVRASAANATS